MTEPDPGTFLEPQPSESQKALLDKFVAEYVKDFNAIAANIRVGFNAIYAKEYANVFLGKPYVQRKIMEFKSAPQPDEASRIAQLKQRVESVYIMAMESGDLKAAVTAATKLGEMHGFMEAPDKSGEELSKVVDFFKEVAKAVPD